MLTLTNVRVFDGHRMLSGLHSVAMDASGILAIDQADASGNGERIDGGGMTVMPGLTTCHMHPDFYKFSIAQGSAGEQLGKELPPGVLMAIGVRTCRVLLESGFTGYVGAACSNDIDAQLKIAIAEGIVPGPRIRACSHHISTTGDANDSLKWWQRFDTPGIDLFADGPDALRKLVREEIRRGAETIKVIASSGHAIPGHRGLRNVSSDELAAIVKAAHERGVKVRTHACDKEMILECVELGVDIIDHGDEVDEECIERMAARGTFWVPSLTLTRLMIDVGFCPGDGAAERQYSRVLRMLPLAQKAGVRLLIGDDYSGMFRDLVEDDPLDHEVGCYGRELGFYGAVDGLAAVDVLGWATRNPGELLSDGRAKVGVIERGAVADVILVDGDPLSDLGLFSRPETAVKAVIRDGRIVVDRLDRHARRDRGSAVPKAVAFAGAA